MYIGNTGNVGNFPNQLKGVNIVHILVQSKLTLAYCTFQIYVTCRHAHFVTQNGNGYKLLFLVTDKPYYSGYFSNTRAWSPLRNSVMSQCQVHMVNQLT